MLCVLYLTFFGMILNSKMHNIKIKKHEAQSCSCWPLSEAKHMVYFFNAKGQVWVYLRMQQA